MAISEAEKQQHVTVQSRLVAAGIQLMTLDLETFLAALHRAQTVAPLVDPTLWLRGNENLHALIKLTEAAIPMKKAAQELMTASIKTFEREEAREK